jgi:hypothetical protein
VKTRMDNGISGFLPLKNLSDKHVQDPEDRVQVCISIAQAQKTTSPVLVDFHFVLMNPPVYYARLNWVKPDLTLQV